MPTTSKQELLDKMDQDFAKFWAELEGLPEHWQDHRPDWEEVTVREMVLQRVHWLELFFDWWAQGQNGEHVFVPAEGFTMNDLRAYNAKIREECASTDWTTALDMLQDRHHRLRDWVSKQSEETLFTQGVPAWTGKWTLGRYAEASSAKSYRTARKYIRACLRHRA